MSHGDEDTRTAGRRLAPQQGPGDRDRPCFIVIRGLNVGEMYKLARNEMVVGRGQHADIEILDDGISRRHARVRFAEDRVEIEDLGSRNGTFVNGQRIEGRSQTLRDGDKVQLSSTTILKFTFADRLDESFQRRMYESALRDALTKAFNKKYFLDRLEREFRFAKRHKQPLALVMFDVDAFRRLNDDRGAAAGDHVLGTIAGQIHHVIRSEDVFARYGGDEFAVICRATDGAGAILFADRVRAELAACSFTHEGDPMVVTVSTGIAAMEPEHPDAMSLLAATEEALAVARASGRDRLQVAGKPPPRLRPSPTPPDDEPTTTVSPKPSEPPE